MLLYKGKKTGSLTKNPFIDIYLRPSAHTDFIVMYISAKFGYVYRHPPCFTVHQLPRLALFPCSRHDDARGNNCVLILGVAALLQRRQQCLTRWPPGVEDESESFFQVLLAQVVGGVVQVGREMQRPRPQAPLLVEKVNAAVFDDDGSDESRLVFALVG